MWERQPLPPSHAKECFSIQTLVNSEIFKLLLNLSLTHLRTQIACFQLKGDLIYVMLKGVFHDSLQGFVWKTIDA